jgi:hypothetical protein
LRNHKKEASFQRRTMMNLLNTRCTASAVEHSELEQHAHGLPQQMKANWRRSSKAGTGGAGGGDLQHVENAGEILAMVLAA